jgi:hypothetical protein
MKKTIEENWKPSYFYIRYVTVGQLLPIIKQSLISFFAFIFLFGIIGYFTVDDWNISGYEQGKINWEKGSFGIDASLWFLILFATVSWFMKGKERTFRIPRFDKIEWLMFNLCAINFYLIFSYLSWWLGMVSFAGMIVLGRAYEDMVYIGKENYQGRSFYE